MEFDCLRPLNEFATDLIASAVHQVLLVKGWQKGASWSFPRGKINKEEAEGMCAVREVC